MQAWLTPPDREGVTWRIEVGDQGVQVFRQVGRRHAAKPVPDVHDVVQLGAWVVKRGIDTDDLRPVRRARKGLSG